MKKNNSTMGIRLMCAIVFVIFSVGWLYSFQPDIMTMSQHVLSKGLTHYNPVIGCVCITLILILLQFFVAKSSRLRSSAYALSYFPSMLVLGLLTAVTENADGGIYFDCHWLGIVLVIALWIGAVWVVRQLQGVFRPTEVRLFSRPVWLNMLIMSLLMICTVWIGNTNAVFHYRMRAEQCLTDGDMKGALMVGRKSLEGDEHLLMLRMYALARENALGEHLFEYPITGNSSQMLPTDSLSCMMFYPQDSLYKFIGARPASRMSPMRYLELVQQRDSLPNKTVADYLLCGYLIDRQIDDFVKELGKYYHIDDSLPKHYREALTLYTHTRSRPLVVYHHAVMDEDYDNLMQLEKQYPDKSERRVKVEEQYRGTYWYYYKYEK
ncbi:DUF6057 family protein [Prevotella sp. FD3004]|uniref:DUF6057 family protein n=1 Tax=Prevotella sp. FD3004 TaxID=1408309 RepID=UPI00055F2CB9|nr:DUF6057 family protein [Prevotella sp. FD3004]